MCWIFLRNLTRPNLAVSGCCFLLLLLLIWLLLLQLLFLLLLLLLILMFLFHALSNSSTFVQHFLFFFALPSCLLRKCVDAVLRLLGVFHDVLYGDVAPVRPGSTLGVVSVRLSRSFFVPGRHLKKGGSPPFPPLLAPTPGWPPRGGLVSAPQLPTPGSPLRERRETPPRQCAVAFFIIIIFSFFFFLGGGRRAVRGVWG